MKQGNGRWKWTIIHEIFALLGCYTPLIGNFRRFGMAYKSLLQVALIAWVLTLGRLGRPETSLTTYQRYVKYLMSEDIIYTIAEAWNHAYD